MSAPAAPNVVLNPYYRTDGTVRFNFITTPDVQGADIDIYDSDSTLVYTGAAAGIQDLWSETWTLDVPVAYFGTAGETYDVSVHVFNDDGDTYVTTSFAVYDPPTVTLLPAEGTTITDLPLTILWTVTDPTGVSKQVLRVSGASSVVYASDYSPATALDTDARSIVLDSSNMLNVPADGETYSVRITVTNGVGFSTTVTHSVSVSWQPPVTPTATVTTDPDTLTASVTVTGDRTYDFTDVESFTAPESGVITSLVVDGKSVQNGTPTPSAPVAIESVKSRNLLNAYRVAGSGGLTFTQNSDGTVSISGTATGTATVYFTDSSEYSDNIVLGAGTYTLSGGLPNGTASTHYLRATCTTLSTSAVTRYSDTGSGITFTLSEPCKATVFFHASSGENLTGSVIRPMLESGSPAHDYQPYGSITLVAGTTRTDIDMQGHALRSLPDGTHDELTVDSAGVVTLTQRVGAITYDGSADESWSLNTSSGARFLITIPTAVKAAQSDTSHGLAISTSLPLLASGGTGVAGADGFTITAASQLFCAVKTAMPSVTTVADWTTYLSSNPMTVLYPLATPQTISLGTITPPFVAEGATVAIDAAVTPTFDATMRAAQSAGTPLTDTLMVVRVSPDGTRHVLADDLESGDSVTDPLPPLGVEYTYEVTGIAASGVPSTAAIVPVTINTGAWALNFGEHAEEYVLFRYNPSASYSIEHGGELYHFADGGANGGLPRWYSTTDRDESGSISWNTVDRARAMKLHNLSLAHPVGWIRDPYGRSWRARIVPSMSHERTRVLKVSISWDKVVWEEP